MATIKSYTSLEQSRKLAEILPLESADMFLAMNGIVPVMSKYIDNGLVTADETAIPCWSLAALLGVLPDIHLKKYIYDGITKYYTTLVGIKQFNSEHYDNPIDACVAMIEHLHELKML